MTKKFKTFASCLDEAKPVSDFDFKAFRQKMKEIEKNARRHQAQAVSAAKEAMLTR